MVHAALLLLMLEAVAADLVSTISLKRSTQNLQRTKRRPADYSIFRSGDRENPFESSHYQVQANDWHLIRAEHWGQRPHLPHQQAGHVTAPDQCCRNVKKALAMAPSTRDRFC